MISTYAVHSVLNMKYLLKTYQTEKDEHFKDLQKNKRIIDWRTL